jgi:aspartate racemase
MKIGILGGMGAYASLRAHQLILHEAKNRGAKADSDFPEIVHISLASTGLNETGVADEHALILDLRSGIKQLNCCGVDKIIVACNTAHIYYNRMQTWSLAPILDMPMITMLEAAPLNNTIGVISSGTSRDSELYTRVLRSLNIKVLEPDDQNEVDAIIDTVIQIGFSTTDKLSKMIYQMRSDGATAVILACTELPLVSGLLQFYGQMEVIDPLQVVVRKAFQ